MRATGYGEIRDLFFIICDTQDISVCILWRDLTMKMEQITLPQGNRSIFLREGALKIRRGPVWLWSLKFILMLFRSRWFD